MHEPKPSPGDLPQQAAAVLESLRKRSPRVHCLTNAVAQNFTANVLLAAGCLPSMTISPEEVGDFVAGANALLVNLGTFDRERREATEIAVKAANDTGVSWVLDPVFIDRSERRTDFARKLLDRAPKAIRLNGAEFAAMSGRGGNAETIADFARGHGCVVALSGPTDLVSDGDRSAGIENGDPLMAKVTAMGCAASALIAACLAAESDAWRAAASGVLLLGVAGEMAAEQAKGPASFAVAIVDALYAIDGRALVERARVSR